MRIVRQPLFIQGRFKLSHHPKLSVTREAPVIRKERDPSPRENFFVDVRATTFGGNDQSVSNVIEFRYSLEITGNKAFCKVDDFKV